MNPYNLPSIGKYCVMALFLGAVGIGGYWLQDNLSTTMRESKEAALKEQKTEAAENSVLEKKIKAQLDRSSKSVMKNQELFDVIREFDCRQTTKLNLSRNIYVARLVVGKDIRSCAYSVSESNIANPRQQKISIQIPKYLAQMYVKTHDFRTK